MSQRDKCLGQRLLLARLMGQHCFSRWRLSFIGVVCDAACGRAGRRARVLSGGRHCTAGQYGYVPLGRHLVYSSKVIVQTHTHPAEWLLYVHH